MVSEKLLCFVLLTLSTTVYSHGMLCTPRQRGAYQSSKCGTNLPFPKDPVTDHCAHCLNGGTVATVTSNLPSSGWSIYDPIKDPNTGTRAGLCGDPVGDNSHMIGGSFMPYRDVPIVANWRSGAAVDFEVELDTNHNGYFEFFLCNLDTCRSRDIAGKCMQNGHCHRLTRIPHPDCQKPSTKTHFECGPIDRKHPGRWYVPCRKTGHVGVHLVGGARGTMKYRLPNGLHCKHCVLQWYWASGNSCAPKGFLDYFRKYRNPFGTVCDSDGGGRGAHRPGMATCGGSLVPEEFWSCADVSISPAGSQKQNKRPLSNNQRQRPNTPTTTNVPKMSQPASDSEAYPDMVTPIVPESENNPEIYPLPKTPSPTVEPAVPKTTDDADTNSVVDNEAGGNGTCLGSNRACDGSVSCCGHRVCVYTKHRGFICKLWYTLWREFFVPA